MSIIQFVRRCAENTIMLVELENLESTSLDFQM